MIHFLARVGVGLGTIAVLAGLVGGGVMMLITYPLITIIVVAVPFILALAYKLGDDVI